MNNISKMDNSKLNVIDLTIPENEQGYIIFLRVNGITKTNNPKFFQDIDVIKTKQINMIRKQGSIKITEDASKPSTFLSRPIINYSQDDENVTGEIFHTFYYPNSSEFASVQDALTLFQLSKNNGEIVKVIASGSNEKMNKDIRFVKTIAKSVTPNEPNNIDKFPIQAISTTQFNIGGYPYGPYITNAYIDDLTPKYMYNESPEKKDKRSDKPIVICLNRADPTSINEDACDYGPMSPDLSPYGISIQLELIGSVMFKNPISLEHKHDITISLIGENTGGACQVRFIDDDNIYNHIMINEKRDALTWDFSKNKTYIKNNDYANFGNICWRSNSEYVLTIQGTIWTELSKGTVPVMFTYTSEPNEIKSSNKYIYHPIVIQYGCIIEGTLIDMADGSKKKVENIREGDLVLSKDDKILRIKSRIVGFDTDFVDLHYQIGSDENQVTLTPTHPVLTQRGILRAKDLNKGDVIYSRNGNITLDLVNKKKTKSQNVYNFVLENITKNDELFPDDALLYAGGVLVGDNILQGKLSVKD
jgi:hypothetical protein